MMLMASYRESLVEMEKLNQDPCVPNWVLPLIVVEIVLAMVVLAD